MVLTESTMFPLGEKAPDFTLLDTVSGKKISLNELKSKTGTVILFICNHCPYVKHIAPALPALANEYQSKGIQFIAISANDAVEYPEDAPDKMAEVANTMGYNFPYLYDEHQTVAKAYQAACTPDFYVFDADLRCVYRGRLDDSRPDNEVPVTGKDIRSALDALIAGKPVSPDQKPSMGCNIKWKNATT